MARPCAHAHRHCTENVKTRGSCSISTACDTRHTRRDAVSEGRSRGAPSAHGRLRGRAQGSWPQGRLSCPEPTHVGYHNLSGSVQRHQRETSWESVLRTSLGTEPPLNSSEIHPNTAEEMSQFLSYKSVLQKADGFLGPNKKLDLPKKLGQRSLFLHPT